MILIACHTHIQTRYQAKHPLCSQVPLPQHQNSQVYQNTAEEIPEKGFKQLQSVKSQRGEIFLCYLTEE